MIEEVIDRLSILLKGEIPEKVDAEDSEDPQARELVALVNQLIAFMAEIHAFIVPLSRGELHDVRLQPGNFLASPFKELHSRLLHLTWQAEQVAKGDYSQRVDFMGDFSEAFNAMIAALDRNEKLLREKIGELEGALAHIKRLEGILPICSSCKRVRLDEGDPRDQDSWLPIEDYLGKETEAQFTHSICPACRRRLYPGLPG